MQPTYGFLSLLRGEDIVFFGTVVSKNAWGEVRSGGTRGCGGRDDGLEEVRRDGATAEEFLGEVAGFYCLADLMFVVAATKGLTLDGGTEDWWRGGFGGPAVKLGDGGETGLEDRVGGVLDEVCVVGGGVEGEFKAFEIYVDARSDPDV